MDFFHYCNDTLVPGEEVKTSQNGIRFYDGDEKVKIRDDVGTATLTSHRIKWKNQTVQLCLELKYVESLEKTTGRYFLGTTRSPKITVYLRRDGSPMSPSPFPNNSNNHIKITFTDGGFEEFSAALERVLEEKCWAKPIAPAASGRYRAGIVGIERQLEREARKTEKDISEAFQDINSLIDMAKPMVQLANTISGKIKDRQGNISDDETIKFRQHLLSLGIKDPVTKEKYGHGNTYFEKLAAELSNALSNQVKEQGGMMSLVEAYCRLNRARVMDLVSPEDLMNACTCLEKLKLPIQLRTFDTKVKVLQHESLSDDVCVATAISLLDEHYSLTPEEYATTTGMPLLLAKHSLLLAETSGNACRDESVEGIRFFPNLFVDNVA